MASVNSLMFLRIGNRITETKCRQNISTKSRRFKSFFGVTPAVCEIIWNQISGQKPDDYKPKYLLWGLNFLKQYSTEHTRHSLFKADEKTIRKWSWITVKLLSDLNVVIWENRMEGSVDGQTVFVSLDGVDCKIKEPSPFSRKWYSHKFKGPGLRYEIGLNIRTGDIVWKHGGYPCGQYPDLVIAREVYVHSVNDGEKTLADKDYRDHNFFILPTRSTSELHGRIMARHETVNKRLKQFNALKHSFRHEVYKQPMVFNAIANLAQLMIRNGEPLFTV